MGLICVLIVVFSGLSGVFISNKYREKRFFYQNLSNFTCYLKTNISFYKTRLEVLIDKYNCSPKFKNILNKINENLSNKNLTNILPNYLNSEEKDEIEKFIISLQNFDAIETIKSIDYFDSLNKTKLAQVCDEARVKVPLIEKLSIGAGLIIAIILI